ncbi:hypothetical protein ACHAW6_001592 [Cyclotella cf. meneghiniana]
MIHKSEAHEALGLHFAWDGVPLKMIVDNAKEMKLGEFARKCKEAHCYLRSTESYSPWSNSADHEIREVKKGKARKLMWSGVPLRLWCLALEYELYVCLHTAYDIFQLDKHVPVMVVLGKTTNISPFCEFGFWDWVKLWERGVAFPDNALVHGKYLGPSIDVGPAMSSWVMKANSELEDRLTEDDDGPSFPELDDELEAAKAAGDFLVNSEVLLLSGNSEELARVLRRKWDADGKVMGTTHHNPALDSCIYEVRFPDGRTEELAANDIAEAIYARFDADGNQYVLLDAIVDYRKNPFIAVDQDTEVTIINGKKIIKRSTQGWELRCEWKNGSTSWQKLLDLKESHPLQVEFALATQIADEPTFNWWVSWVLEKRDWIISLVKRQSV